MTSTQQRAELQRQIWHCANEVRGSVEITVARIDRLRSEIDAIVQEIG